MQAVKNCRRACQMVFFAVAAALFDEMKNANFFGILRFLN